MTDTTKTPPIDQQTKRINGLGDIADRYKLIFCDVWGVLHNGVRAWPDAIGALSNFRKSGGTVIMVTNAPRPRGPVMVQLGRLGVPKGTFDVVVTSGDVTRDLLRKAPRKLFFIGLWEKDKNLLEGLDIELVDEKDSEGIICTGLFDEHTETPEDYIEMLTRFKNRNMPFICANPDIVVHVGDRLEFCAGAIAREYSKMGGKTLIAGKPHKPIYQAALGEAENIKGRKFAKSDILAIGDGMPTDIKGAQDFGVDALYVSAGIHAAEYGALDNPDHNGVGEFLKSHGADPVAYMPRLKW